MAEKQVYLPVCVTVTDGVMTQAPYVDFDGAPWMFVTEEDNVWPINPEMGKWEKDNDTEETAINLVSELFGKWGDA